MTNTSSTQHSMLRLIIALGITLIPITITICLYWPGLHGPFLLDDQNNIAPLAFNTLNLDEIINVATHNNSGKLGRPVSALSLALTQHFSGTTSFAFKHTNLMIHCLIGLLIFWLTARILFNLYPKNSATHTWAVAFIVSLLWLIHPLNVSTVLYAVQRMAQLAMLFTITGILCFVIGRQALENGKRSQFWLAILGVSIAFPLSVFSKENGALFPLYIVAIELLVFSRTTLAKHLRRDLITFHAIWVILPLILAAAYLSLSHTSILDGYQDRNFDLLQRLLTQVHVIFFYIQMTLFPKLRDMSLYHDNFPITLSIDITTTLLVATFITISVFAISIRHRHPLITLGITWFLISHLLESTIIPLEMVFEHRNYPAMLGLIIPIVYYLTPSKKTNNGFKQIRIGAIVIIAILLSTQTILRADTWGNKEILLRVTEIDHPNSSRAQTELATILLEKNDVPGGLLHLQKAETLSPLDPGVNLHQVLAHCLLPEIPTNLIENTKNKLANNNFTAYALSGIDILIQRKMHHQCQSATLTDISGLIDAALSNPATNNAIDTSHLKLMQARSYLLQNNYKLAMQSYDQAYAAKSDSLSALLEKTEIQIINLRLNDAQDSLKTIKLNAKANSITEKHNIDRVQNLLDTTLSKNNKGIESYDQNTEK